MENKSLDMTQLEDFYKSFVENNFEECKKSAMESLEYMKNSTAKYKGKPIYSLFAHKLFPEDTALYLKESAEKMYKILIKVMNEYLNNENYRKLFGFSKELEDLIMIPTGYDNLLPIARIDIFLNEKDLSFKYCEFNADGCSAMNEDRELNIALKLTAPYKKLSENYDIVSYELFDSWAKEFMNIYSTYYKKVDIPYIAVVDFLEKGCSVEEFEEFAKSFRKLGADAEVCEIRNLRYKDGILYSPSGNKIDAIYRRAVTCDIMDHKNEVGDFLQAVKDRNVCLVGSFCTHIIHDKIIFKILHMDRTHEFLTEDEIEYVKLHIPYTSRLTASEIDIDSVKENKDKWLIKPEDSYGAKGVFAGINFGKHIWEKVIDDHVDKHYMIQEFCMPYRTYNIDFNKEVNIFEKYSNLTGMYIYNGKFAGFYSRQSNHEIISTQYDENDIASALIKQKS